MDTTAMHAYECEVKCRDLAEGDDLAQELSKESQPSTSKPPEVEVAYDL